MPVGFKWFVPGLVDGSVGFGGEESAGASFLRKDGTVWTTDKDGILPALLASEILATTGQVARRRTTATSSPSSASPGTRASTPRRRARRRPRSSTLTPEQVTATTLAGEPITAKLTNAPGNDAAIGGLKVTTQNAWFAARPSGTEDVYKIYAESFVSAEHLAQVQAEAKDVVSAALGRRSRTDPPTAPERSGGRSGVSGGGRRAAQPRERPPRRAPAARRRACRGRR